MSGELRWIGRSDISGFAMETCSLEYSPSEKLSKKSETDTYSDGKSSTSSQILAMVIQTKLMETRVIDIDKEN